MKTKIGTCFYMSPEVIKGNYNEKCDIWSLGVLLFIMLSGRLPFNGDNDNQIMNKILTGKFEYKWEGWKSISTDCKDLINSILNIDTDKRPSTNEILNHRWIKGNTDEMSRIELIYLHIPFNISKIYFIFNNIY